LVDFRIEKDAQIAQAKRLRDQDGLDLNVEAAKKLKEKAGRAAVIAPLRLFSIEGKERLYRQQLR